MKFNEIGNITFCPENEGKMREAINILSGTISSKECAGDNNRELRKYFGILRNMLRSGIKIIEMEKQYRRDVERGIEFPPFIKKFFEK